MELRLRRAFGDAEYVSDLVVVVPLDVVQDEDGAIAGRQLRDGALKGDAINDRHLVRVLRAAHDLHGRLALFGRKLGPCAPAPKVHEHLIDREPMQPSGEGRLAAKTADLVEEMREDVLRQVFSFGRVAEHAEAERIDAPEV